MFEARCIRHHMRKAGRFSCDLWNSDRFGGGPDVKGLASSIGIDWKGTQLPLKTDRGGVKPPFYVPF